MFPDINRQNVEEYFEKSTLVHNFIKNVKDDFLNYINSYLIKLKERGRRPPPYEQRAISDLENSTNNINELMDLNSIKMKE
jgi:hypothetical protein